MQLKTVTISTISSINQLSDKEKLITYTRLIPPELMKRFAIPADFSDSNGKTLLNLDCPTGSSTAEIQLYHQVGFPDPILHGHITGTITGLVHVLLYVLNDPTSPRFAIDRMPDGKQTSFGTLCRNIPAEQDALEFGLAPGQIRRGLRLLGPAIIAFEDFVKSLGHELFFAEPLFYHNAVIFERYGFAYEKGRRLMDRIQSGFSEQGDLLPLLDGSTPFRRSDAANSIRLRSWAIHDGLLDEPFNSVTMYKRIGKSADICTCPDCEW